MTKTKALVAAKVDAVDGKGLSTNDYTTDEKNKLAGIEAGANNYVHPAHTAHDAGLYKVTVDATGHVSAATAVAKADITALGVPAQDTTYSAASTSAAGLMSAADKAKLDGVATGATANTVDSALSSTSTNAVQNKIVNAAITAKAPLVSPALTGTPTAPTATSGTNSTQIATTAFVTSAVASAVSGITSFNFSIVTSLPTSGVTGTIYLISNGGSETQNSYDEYIWVNSKWEKIGTTAVDLSGYLKTTDMVAITSSEIDAMFA